MSESDQIKQKNILIDHLMTERDQLKLAIARLRGPYGDGTLKTTHGAGLK